MKVPLKFAELHAPLFLAGRNLQMKLDPRQKAGLSLVYEQEERMLLVTIDGETAMVPLSNVVSMVEGEVRPRVQPVAVPEPPKAIGTAQVDSPQAHVFAGPGKGKTK